MIAKLSVRLASDLRLVDKLDSGAGHLPILRHAAAASPDAHLVEPREFPRQAAR